MSYQDGLRHADTTLDPLAALRSPTTILLGVNEAARSALAGLGIATVFDLATSPLFGLAYEIGEAVQGRGPAAISRFETVPGGAAAASAPTRLVDFANAELTAIRSLTPAQANELATALEVRTVADLGRWLPYRSARNVLAAAGGVRDVEDDTASELVPRMGEFPTERRYYSTIVMDHVVATETQDLATAGPVDISPAIDANFGFSAPAVGARLTFEQSWYAHGMTLGNLLHSVALAPGESTRIAVVDWSRQTRAAGTETIGETEALTQQTSHNRAVSEVQEAVANEIQSGFSHTESKATTKQAGGGFGLSVGPVSVGGSASAGTTKTSADSFSTSAGSRELAASMSQQVMDSTQQAASSVRNRRATLVKEISETEHEAVSTRILANYNHMHALTVQYYEVIEIYRVVIGLHEVERCLFVPMKLVDFDDKTIVRYQGALADAALTRRALELLSTEFGMVSIAASLPMRPFLSEVLSVVNIGRIARTRAIARERERPTTPEGTDSAAAPPPPPPPPEPPPEPQEPAWDPVEIRRISRITSGHVARPGSTSLLLPRDATLEGVSVALERGAPITGVTLRLRSGAGAIELTRTSIGFRVPTTAPLDELLEISVTTAAGTERAKGTIGLELSYRGAFFPVSLPIDVAAGSTSVVARTGETESAPELVEHLRANRLHYNQAIWRSLDASTVALLLSKFTFEGQQVADLIDPRPIQVAGNYLVFRMPGFVTRATLPFVADDDSTTPEAVARRAWLQYLADRGLTFGSETRQNQLVPVPTGGVFAEAILGRSNAAEKLDATRFWNWQDSPIPLQPPEIAAIQMGSRAQPVDVTPGQLGQPVLNIVNPTALPDPTGVGSIIGALQSGNIFRDMSGLAATIGLAQSTSQSATSAAAEAGKLAAANLAVAAQKEIEQNKIAAQLALAALGNPKAMEGTPKNISEMGALLNTADKRDQAKAAAGASGGEGSETGGGAEIPGGGDGGGGGSDGGGGGGGTIESTGSRSVFASGGESSGDLAFRRATFGALGAPVADLIRTGGGQPGTSGGTVQSPSTSSPFTTEIFFWAHVVRGPGLDTLSGEVDALDNQTWMPSGVDFRAISIRSAGGRQPRSDAEVSTVGEFLKILALPAGRFNFFGYDMSDDLNLDVVTRPSSLQGGAAGAAGSLDSPSVNLDAIAAFREVAGLTTGGGPLAEAIRAIRKRNKEFKDQKPGGRTVRELWLAIVNDPCSEAVASELAKGLGMRVVIYEEGVIFRPVFRTSPPAILKRGVIEMFGEQTSDLHDFDRFGVTFDP